MQRWAKWRLRGCELIEAGLVAPSFAKMIALVN
ncbi:hypothetical protein PAA8504_02398 [Palleronia abyssalis]|uniref:Uncharacterized protein n=1 Tax=Palleronia abyssalis TaxID=1501240 RepID=A0A2R8BWN2_9RHOB|nr:hypothetical protein PAA8504_02398 [Palleronia abyssalis]